MSNEAREQVELILKNCEVSYSAGYVALTERGDGDTKWQCDEWRIQFTRTRAELQKVEKFKYFTGLGHRAPATAAHKQTAAYGFPGLTDGDRAGRTSYGRRYLAEIEKLRKPVAPHAADVLYSLLMDSSAVGQSFESWCSELGMDSDSRKAEATYRACQENADKLARIFDHVAREALQTALQDY